MKQRPAGAMKQRPAGPLYDYSLRVENLPQAPPPKGQMDLFGEEPD